MLVKTHNSQLSRKCTKQLCKEHHPLSRRQLQHIDQMMVRKQAKRRKLSENNLFSTFSLLVITLKLMNNSCIEFMIFTSRSGALQCLQFSNITHYCFTTQSYFPRCKRIAWRGSRVQRLLNPQLDSNQHHQHAAWFLIDAAQISANHQVHLVSFLRMADFSIVPCKDALLVMSLSSDECEILNYQLCQ